MDALLQTIDKERDHRFKKPWSKLDKGSRLNRISQFVKFEKTNNSLTNEEESKLKILLVQLSEFGDISKSGSVIYNVDEEHIESIPKLLYDEETHTYSFKRDTINKKMKSTPKSKSNIARHFSRSHEHKR